MDYAVQTREIAKRTVALTKLLHEKVPNSPELIPSQHIFSETGN
jgi:hypothetical protein